MLKPVATAALLAATLMLGGCFSVSDQYDEIYDLGTSATGGVVTGADAPVGFVGANWVTPHEQKAEDITLADLPGFAFGATDPFNVLPPPFGTFYVPWKLFVTVVRAIPFVTYSEAGDGGGSVTWLSGSEPGPVWYAIGPAIEDLDSYVVPATETVAANHVPAPGFGDYRAYWSRRARSHLANMRHAGNTLKYLFLNANSNLPPFENWFPETMERDKTTIHYTFDAFLFNFDWDDPYID